MEKNIWKNIQRVKTESPLVQNITNFVVMNNTANALLAVGASPIMSHAIEEAEDMNAICTSLVINIGTLDTSWTASMLNAAKLASESNKPWVLDPVGAGASAYRNTVLTQLLELKPTVVRGNASEILALANSNRASTKGVDSTASSNEAIDAAVFINQKYGSVVCISGETDIIIDDNRKTEINNGHELMTKVTGLGCSATAVIGAFIAIIDDKQEAVAAAMALFSISGELAVKQSNGPGSLQMNLLDKLYNITEDEFLSTIKLV